LWDGEARLRVERLNLDAASFRQLRDQHRSDGAAIRAAVLDIVSSRGKMHNPVTGSGGMLLGTVDEVTAASPLGLSPGDSVASLVSLTCTPLVIIDGLSAWDGRSEQAPCDGFAVLFARSIAARMPDDLPSALALAALDVCGAPALTARIVRDHIKSGQTPKVLVIGGGKSGSLSLAAARRAGAGEVVVIVPDETEATLLRSTSLADEVLLADARDPIAVADAVGKPAHVTVVCVDVSGCEGGAILATRQGGTVVFFSMATSFPAAALGAEAMAADVTMIVGNGYVPGHADYAIDLLRTEPGVRRIFDERLSHLGLTG
jgi:L-erythro-3,5-diaminohexanoate dehydrogenase